jgi:DNA repair exonuclease SbcCD ATPase subunit
VEDLMSTRPSLFLAPLLALGLGCSDEPDRLALSLAKETAKAEAVTLERDLVVQKIVQLEEQVVKHEEQAVASRAREDELATAFEVQNAELVTRTAKIEEYRTKYLGESLARKTAEARARIAEGDLRHTRTKLSEAESKGKADGVRIGKLESGLGALTDRYATVSFDRDKWEKKAATEKDRKHGARWDAFKNAAMVAVCSGGKKCEEAVGTELDGKAKELAWKCMVSGGSSPDIRKGKPAVPRPWKVELELPGLFRGDWYVYTCDPNLHDQGDKS